MLKKKFPKTDEFLQCERFGVLDNMLKLCILRIDISIWSRTVFLVPDMQVVSFTKILHPSKIQKHNYPFLFHLVENFEILNPLSKWMHLAKKCPLSQWISVLCWYPSTVEIYQEDCIFNGSEALNVYYLGACIFIWNTCLVMFMYERARERESHKH